MGDEGNRPNRKCLKTVLQRLFMAKAMEAPYFQDVDMRPPAHHRKPRRGPDGAVIVTGFNDHVRQALGESLLTGVTPGGRWGSAGRRRANRPACVRLEALLCLAR